MKFVLEVFDRISDDFVQSYVLNENFTVKKVRALFMLGEDDPAMDCYEINWAHQDFVKNFISIEWNFKEFAYFVCAVADK